ncbi:MAG TPA: sugar phosphate nucleotidyltransferase [Acidimicrobiales bacterium]|nr:sugar phosphate nucleotidyltransferase [Acidimicrobiales bacterium]
MKPVLVVLAAGMAKRFGGGCKPLAPLGLRGEAVIDLTTGDALRAGFGDVILVIGPQTGPAIEYHVRRTWPRSVNVSFALQEVPLGTAHALLCAHPTVEDRSFAAVNADDVYGAQPLDVLAAHLRSPALEHCLVSFQLRDSVSSAEPVTRGTCEVGQGGLLERITERRQVTRRPDGTFHSADGLEPSELDPSTPVSMNLWGLRPTIWPVLENAVVAVHGEDPTKHSEAEVLLPEVVGEMVEGRTKGGVQHVRVLRGEGRCVGVTHAADLPAVRAELAGMIARGMRSESPWDGVA